MGETDDLIDQLEKSKIPQNRKLPKIPDNADFLFKFYKLYDFISESEALLSTGISFNREIKEIELYQQSLKLTQSIIKKKYDDLQNKKFWIQQQIKNNKNQKA